VNQVYNERNHVVLLAAQYENELCVHLEVPLTAGYYYDDRPEVEGFRRVISMSDGKLTWHVPDDFSLGDLPEIQPNWDGHTTEMKYQRIREWCGAV